MISSWRRKKAFRQTTKTLDLEAETELTVPNHFRCPISLDLMKDPVTVCTGMTYDRQSIERWIEAGNKTCPSTNQVLVSFDTIPNHTIRKMIQDWCVENRMFGVERIPTPRIPVNDYEVLGVLGKIVVAGKRGDGEACRRLVVKIRCMAKESERNKRCVAVNGAGTVLSSAYVLFSDKFEQNCDVLEEILSAITVMTPIEADAKACLVSNSPLRSIVWFLKSGDLSSRRNAVLVLKELLSSSSDQKKVLEELTDMEGALESVVNLIKEPICPTTTKAALLTLYHMVANPSLNEKPKARLVQLGLLDFLIELLVDSDRSIIEKALGVLNGLCCCKQGRELAILNALIMPVLVKKMLRVSEMATEFSVSIILKLCKEEKREDGGVIFEALQVGAFQKLLLLLQVGSSERTKEKAKELLKLLNLHKGLECIDSLDFKNLKRP